jgi:hypothetical protein
MEMKIFRHLGSLFMTCHWNCEISKSMEISISVCFSKYIWICFMQWKSLIGIGTTHRNGVFVRLDFSKAITSAKNLNSSLESIIKLKVLVDNVVRTYLLDRILSVCQFSLSLCVCVCVCGITFVLLCFWCFIYLFDRLLELNSAREEMVNTWIVLVKNLVTWWLMVH